MKSSSAVFLMLLALVFVFPVTVNAAPKKKFVVVIDAGHGGTDVGAQENGVNEKDVNLAVALKLGDLIKKKLKDVEVVYTRNTDKFVSLQSRANIANAVKGDLFISIHCNSVARENTNRANVLGATTYILGHHKDNDNLAVAQRENSVVELDANDSANFAEYDASDESYIIFEMTAKKNFQNSARFAKAVQDEFEAIGRKSRGVQQAGFYVLWSTAMPAALIELDFLCNPEQAKFLNSAEGQDKLAGAIFKAVKEYEVYFRKNLGTYTAEAKKEAKNKEKDSKKKNKNTKDSKLATPAQTAIVNEISEESEVEIVELPASTSSPDTRQRRHRASTSSSVSGAAPSSKPASSSSAATRRRRGAKTGKTEIPVEETTIAFVEEPRNDSYTISQETKKETKKTSVATDQKTDSSKKADKQAQGKKSGKKANKGGVKSVFKILLFVSDKKLKGTEDDFHGLEPVGIYRQNNQYQYTYGESESKEEMETLLEELKENFPDARVIQRYL